LISRIIEKFQTWQIPNGGGIVRHMMPTRDGNIAMAMSGLNMVGIVEIRVRRTDEGCNLRPDDDFNQNKSTKIYPRG
jgi:hypothetical protein